MHLTVAEGALVTIAVAASIQMILTAGAAVAAFVAWKRASQVWQTERAALESRVDEAMSLVRMTSRSVDRVTHKATSVADDAERMLAEVSGVVRTVTGTMSAPRTLWAAGAAAGARVLLRRWKSKGSSRR
jgi:hypothetical protein